MKKYCNITKHVALSKKIEEKMKYFYCKLNERDRRWYAGLEALKIGDGGIEHISKILNCCRKTVRKGKKEIQQSKWRKQTRLRSIGGGRKKYDEKHKNISKYFLEVIENHTAGNPMRIEQWTNLSAQEIAKKISLTHGIKVSKTVVQKLLKKHCYGYRQIAKNQTMKQVEYRNEQFENIRSLKEKYFQNNNPVISMDTKKKEFLGNFYRPGKSYSKVPISAYDHDFNSFATGTVVPHCLYDLKLNQGYVRLASSHDTSELACHSIQYWWTKFGKKLYPNANSILILCDSGGSNNHRHHIFKQDLYKLANKLSIEIRIAHYPPYCSKYNPIEHRLFPHITRACKGVIFDSIKTVKYFIQKTKTNAGLKVHVYFRDCIYKLKRKVESSFKENMPIVFDNILPSLNYRAIPGGEVI